MKKWSISVLTSAFMALVLTSCLKDKDFENQKYGIEIKEVKGIAFPQAAGGPYENSLQPIAGVQTIEGPQITVEHPGAAAADVHIKVELNTSVAGYTALPAGVVTATPLDLVIPAGQKFTPSKIMFSVVNANTLDFRETYAFSITITSVDQGYVIAENMKTVVYEITLPNPWDGLYRINASFFHPTNADIVGNFTFDDVELRRGSTALKVVMFWRTWAAIPGGTGFAHPLLNQTTGNPTTFANQAPILTIDPTTNAVTNIDNKYEIEGVAGAVKYVLDPSYSNRYEPTTKTFYLQYMYTAAGGDRIFTDTLTYLGPR